MHKKIVGSILVTVAGMLACAGTAESTALVGTRSDGLQVVCTSDGDATYACDPQQPSGHGPRTGDGCASWAEGGPALVLWPPNHKLHTVTLADCARVRADCSVTTAALHGGRILAVTSDEALDVRGGGDGNTAEGDLAIVDPTTVVLRSERQGGGDGRVYRIELVDANGKLDVCEVHVPHDRGPFGGAHDSGEHVRVLAP